MKEKNGGRMLDDRNFNGRLQDKIWKTENENIKTWGAEILTKQDQDKQCVGGGPGEVEFSQK